MALLCEMRHTKLKLGRLGGLDGQGFMQASMPLCGFVQIPQAAFKAYTS